MQLQTISPSSYSPRNTALTTQSSSNYKVENSKMLTRQSSIAHQSKLLFRIADYSLSVQKALSSYQNISAEKSSKSLQTLYGIDIFV